MVRVKLQCVEELKVRYSTSLISLAFPSKREETRLIVRMKNYKPCTVLVLSSVLVELENAEIEQEMSSQKIFQTAVIRAHFLYLVSSLPGEK